MTGKRRNMVESSRREKVKTCCRQDHPWTVLLQHLRVSGGKRPSCEGKREGDRRGQKFDILGFPARCVP